MKSFLICEYFNYFCKEIIQRLIKQLKRFFYLWRALFIFMVMLVTYQSNYFFPVVNLKEELVINE